MSAEGVNILRLIFLVLPAICIKILFCVKLTGMSTTKQIGKFFNGLDPVTWHRHVMDGLNTINKQHSNPVKTVIVQKPVQFGVSIVAVASGSLAFLREGAVIAGKVLATPLTLTVGAVRVLTWSHIAEKPYQLLPGVKSITETAHRAASQAAGVIFSAIGGLSFLIGGTQFNVERQVHLGNYSQKRKVKPLYYPPPVVIEANEIQRSQPVHPAIVVRSPEKESTPSEPQKIISIRTSPHEPIKSPEVPLQKSVPAEEKQNLKKQIEGYRCALDKLDVPSQQELKKCLELMKKSGQGEILSSHRMAFGGYVYIPSAGPKTLEETRSFITDFAKSDAQLVVTLNTDEDLLQPWWRACEKPFPIGNGMTIERIIKGAGYEEEVIPTNASVKEERIVKRTFSVIDASGMVVRKLTQLHYENWVGTSEPSYFNNLQDRAMAVSPKGAPIFVHCQDGRDRSGAFIAAHSLSKTESDKKFVNIPTRILKMRKFKSEMVSSEYCLQAIYRSLRHRFKPPLHQRFADLFSSVLKSKEEPPVPSQKAAAEAPGKTGYFARCWSWFGETATPKQKGRGSPADKFWAF